MGLRDWINQRRAEIKRGKIELEKDRAERLRKKRKRVASIEPGTIRYGLAYKQNPLELMRDAKERRETRRKEKQRNRDNNC